MLKILGRVTSINVRKVLWTAGELGLAYDREDWGMPIRDPKVPEFLALNPNGQVPVLIEDGFVLWESNAILVYLAEKDGGGALLPADLQLRATVLQWLFWQATELNPPWGYAVNALVRKTPGYDDEAKIADSIARWTRVMEILEGHLEKGEAFVAGAQFTLADIAIALSVHRWFLTPFERKGLPAVSDYYERMKEREAGKPWMGAGTP
jgi:glutathione S-transferase